MHEKAIVQITHAVGGAGLGLAICKGFIEAHDGCIAVSNAYPGAAFTFSLPIAKEHSSQQVFVSI